MRVMVDGSETINFYLELGYGTDVEESGSLLDYGWDGEQGEELDKFLNDVYLELVFNNVSGSLSFEDEELEEARGNG